MKEETKNICEELRTTLSNTMEGNAEELLQRDAELVAEMNAFEQALTAEQRQHWNALRGRIDRVRRDSKLIKMRLLGSDEEVLQKVGQVEQGIEGSDDYNEAMVQIEREMHQPSGISGIFKSLFMWKPNPEDRV